MSDTNSINNLSDAIEFIRNDEAHKSATEALAALVAERDRLRAENARLREQLGDQVPATKGEN